MAKFINFVLFQAVWFGCVVGAANGYAWLGPLCLLVFAGYHFTMQVKHRYADMLLMAMCVLIGLLLDSTWGYLALVEFTLYDFKPIAPLWLLCLWAGFALTVNHSMDWIKRSLLLSSVGGAVFGPLSYYAGWQAGAMQWLDPIPAAIAIGSGWALTMPALAMAAKHLKHNN